MTMEVRVEGLSFARDRRVVLDVPALCFGAGRTTALFGPNGSGKTTLLRLIAGLERPAAGRVLVGGRAAAADRATRRRIAYAFQEAIFLDQSVAQNLEIGLELRGVGTPERRLRIEEAAAECGIAHLLDRSAAKLSGGEAQRVSLARALCLRAPVTLLDEPLSGIDQASRAHLLDELPPLLHRFASTTIVVTHDCHEALRLADDLVVIVDGRVRASGTKSEVFSRPPDVEVARLIGYTVVRNGRGALAIPPGCLVAGEGEVTLVMHVQQLLDLGHHREVVGRIGETQVNLLLPDGGAVPAAGGSMAVHARRCLRFPA
jgi:ABC-type sugar transport system ATPase subunit